MNKEQVIQVVLKSNVNAKKLYDRLLLWDENRIFIENAEALGLDNGRARALTFKYNLKFVKHPARGRNHYRLELHKRLASEWDADLSVEENAKKLNISNGYAWNLRAKFGLSYTRVYKNFVKKVGPKKQDERIERIKKLRQEGLTLEQIGYIYNISKERVRQLIPI